MPPRAKAPAKGKAKPKASRGPPAHKLPPPLPNGEILTDVFKKKWRVGKAVGQGGFGLIYLASDDVTRAVTDTSNYVIKIEPKGNGPLFCETTFYQRVAKPELVKAFTQSHKLPYLSVPPYISSGLHTTNNIEYRFMIMPRLGPDLQKLFEQNNRCFKVKDVCVVAIAMLDALEFIHCSQYVHADIKASNILLGCHNGTVQPNQVYLVDYGLAYRYDIDGRHKEYKEDPRRMHDGTIEFTSRDAHRGVLPSRRGDLEILGYCLLQWLCGWLPWEHRLDNKDYVRDEKIRLMDDIPALLKACFKTKKSPDCLKKYLTAITDLEYDERPNYTQLRSPFRKELGSAKHTLSLYGPTTSPKGRKRKSDAISAEPRTSDPSTSDSDAPPSPIKKHARGKTRSSGDTLTKTPAAKSKNAKIPQTIQVPAAVKSLANRRKSLVSQVAAKRVVAAKKVASRTVKPKSTPVAKQSPQRATPAAKKSPRSIIPGHHSSRLSPRSIIPAAAAKYARPPKTIPSNLCNGYAPAAKLASPCPAASPNTGRRKVKRVRRPGVEIAVQTSPVVRK